MRGMGGCNCDTATLEQKKKATSDEKQKEIGVASSECATETSVGSLSGNGLSTSQSLYTGNDTTHPTAQGQSVSSTNSNSSSAWTIIWDPIAPIYELELGLGLRHVIRFEIC